MMNRERLQRNIDVVRQGIAEASARWDHEVTLCAVTKTVDIETINLSYGCGIRVIGENRVQEAMQKFPALNPDFALHIIGQLQTNKVKYILDFAKMVQSLDRRELAIEIDRRARARGTQMPALVQVNIAREPQKAGIDEDELIDFLRECAHLPGIHVEGLMAIMPFVDDPELVRPYFRRMREWFERIRDMGIPGIEMRQLSMGMSGDYLVAAQEGATMIRVGSSLYGDR